MFRKMTFVFPFLVLCFNVFFSSNGGYFSFFKGSWGARDDWSVTKSSLLRPVYIHKRFGNYTLIIYGNW